MRTGVIFLFVTLLAAGCSDPAPEALPSAQSTAVESVTQVDPAWHVVEAFEVGREVYVRSLALDEKAGSLWVGTSTGVHEVNLSDQNLRNTFTRADGLANEYVFAIYVDDQGYKWFGTNGGGMSRYRDGEWRVFFPMHGLADYWVYSFGQRSQGDVWVGTWAGVNRWQPESEKLSTHVEELINEWVYGIGVDSKDRVWFGTEGGVSMLDGEKWHSWTHKDGLGAENEHNLPVSFNTGLGTRSRHDLTLSAANGDTYNPNYIFSIYVDHKDRVWAGTWGGGVSYFDGRKWNNYTMRDGLAGNVVYSMAETADGSMWFGTDKGLSQFDGERWFTYGRKDGVLSEHVYAIASVPGGELWVGTRGGVTRLGQGKKEMKAEQQ